MQCYERQAMYLQLNEEVIQEIPQLEFDPNLLDDILAEFSIDNFKRLIALEGWQREEIIKRVKAVTGIKTVKEKPINAYQGREERKKTSLQVPPPPGKFGNGLTTYPTIFP